MVTNLNGITIKSSIKLKTTLLFNMPARNASFHSSSMAGGPDSPSIMLGMKHMREVPITWQEVAP